MRKKSYQSLSWALEELSGQVAVSHANITFRSKDIKIGIIGAGEIGEH
jgi:hypothetical protein